jgi:hypothetical protein
MRHVSLSHVRGVQLATHPFTPTLADPNMECSQNCHRHNNIEPSSSRMHLRSAVQLYSHRAIAALPEELDDLELGVQLTLPAHPLHGSCGHCSSRGDGLGV